MGKVYIFTFNFVGSEEVSIMKLCAELQSDAEQSFNEWVKENNYYVENLNIGIEE